MYSMLVRRIYPKCLSKEMYLMCRYQFLYFSTCICTNEAHIWHASMNTLIKCKRPIWKMIVVFLQIKLLRNRYLHEYPCANYMPILQRILQTLYYYILGIIAKSTLTAVPFYVQMRIKKCTIIGFDVLTQVNELDNRSWF